MYSHLGYYGYNNAPWLQQSMSCAPTFNGNFSMPIWGSYTSSNNSNSTTSNEIETKEEYEARKKNEFEENRKNYVEKLENQTKLNEINKSLEKIENGKQEDGSAKIETSMAEYKKLPWWKKATRAVSNMVQGVWKLASTFVGYEEDGSWNWKKGLTNIGCALGVLALTAIPVVGPIIGTGLLYAGVGAGFVGVGKGIYKATQAKTVTELDRAYQEIGSGAFIGVTSAMGIRGLGKTAGSLSGNIFNKSYQMAIKNPWKATMNQVSAGRTAVQTQGFFKTWYNNLKSYIPESAKTKFDKQKQATVDKYNERITNINEQTATIDTRINVLKSKYEARIQRLEAIPNKNEAQQRMLNKAWERLIELDAGKTSSASRRALLQQEKTLMESQIHEIQNCTSKNSWMNLKKESVSHKELQTLREARVKLDTDGTVNLRGATLDKNIADDIKGIENLISRLESVSKEMNFLSKQRYRSMRTMAFRNNKYKNELDAYAGSSRTQLGYHWDINKGQINLLTLPFKALLKGMSLMFKPWEFLDKHGATGLYKIQEVRKPTYEMNMLDGILSMFTEPAVMGGTMYITPEECKEQLTLLYAEKQRLEAELGITPA